MWCIYVLISKCFSLTVNYNGEAQCWSSCCDRGVSCWLSHKFSLQWPVGRRIRWVITKSFSVLALWAVWDWEISNISSTHSSPLSLVVYISLSSGIYTTTTANVSAVFDTQITPSGWTFNIWSVIYVWLTAMIVYIVSGLCRKYSPILISPCLKI